MPTEIEFECIHCGQSLAVDAHGSGQKIHCPRCESGVVVPLVEGIAMGGFSALSDVAACLAANQAVPVEDALAEISDHEDRNVSAPLAAPVGETLAEISDGARTIEEERDALRAELEHTRREAQTIFEKQREAVRFDKERAAATISTLEQRLVQREASLAEAKKWSPMLDASKAEADALRLKVEALSAASRASEEGRTQLKLELQKARHDANESLSKLQAKLEGEKAEAKRQVEHLAHIIEQMKASLAEALQMAPKLELLREESRSLRKEVDVVRGAYATADADRSHFEEQAYQLRVDLVSSKDGREFAALREQLTEAKATVRAAAAAKEGAEGSLVRLQENDRKQKGDIEGLLNRLKVAEQKAEALMDASLQRDNDLLRGIVERQKGELQRYFDEASRFRKTRFGARIVYLLLALGIAIALALAVLWAPSAIEAAKG